MKVELERNKLIDKKKERKGYRERRSKRVIMNGGRKNERKINKGRKRERMKDRN